MEPPSYIGIKEDTLKDSQYPRTSTVYALDHLWTKEWSTIQQCQDIYASLDLLKKANPGNWKPREDYPDQYIIDLPNDPANWPGYTRQLRARPCHYYS